MRLECPNDAQRPTDAHLTSLISCNDAIYGNAMRLRLEPSTEFHAFTALTYCLYRSSSKALPSNCLSTMKPHRSGSGIPTRGFWTVNARRKALGSHQIFDRRFNDILESPADGEGELLTVEAVESDRGLDTLESRISTLVGLWTVVSANRARIVRILASRYTAVGVSTCMINFFT